MQENGNSWRVFCLCVVPFLLLACSTPSEIKSASQQQLALIDELDTAVRDLQASIARFHRDQADLLRIEGRMEIARAAIYASTDGISVISADGLFAAYEREVHPWVMGALSQAWGEAIDKRIKLVDLLIDRETDPLIRARYQLQKNDLRELKARAATIPPVVAVVAQTYRDEIAAESVTAAGVIGELELLRAQIALMRIMQSRVDDWLSIDISPSQEQIDGLTKAIGEARDALASRGGGGS